MKLRKIDMRKSIEETKEYNRKYYRENRDKRLASIAAWKLSNPDKVKNTQKRFRDSNASVILAKTVRYQAAKRHRVPAWADLEKIKAIYQEAARTGMTVDHIVPLRGRLVSGLHVENNLQLLPGSVNYSKGNKFPIKDMI